MRIRDAALLAAGSMSDRKVMAALTILGIVIGPATIVSLVAATQGFSNASAAQFGKLGATTIFVNTGFFQVRDAGSGSLSGGGPVSSGSPSGGRFNLTQAEVTEVEGLKGVSAVLPYYSLTGSLTVGGVGENVQILATDLTELSTVIPSLTLQQGSLPSGSEATAAAVGASVAYPGSQATANLTVNQVISVSGIQTQSSKSGMTRSFIVQGIYASFGASFFSINPDQTIFVPLSVGEGIKHSYNYDGMLVVASNATEVSKVVSEIDGLFNNKVSATAASSILGFQQSFAQSIATLLETVAGISVLVAFIGIMTTMFTSVLERTKEIGILKALGASGGNILLTFLSEAMLTGFIGGLVGAGVGSALSFLVVILLQNGGTGGPPSSASATITPAITPGLLLGVIALATGVGMVAGLYPAWRASKLPPVEALRSL